jgi:hypothetical protein
MDPKERREFQRLKLTRPILATMRGANALILDIGIGGALLEHYGAATLGERFPVMFRWQGEDVILSCEVMRSVVVRTPAGDGESVTSHTGVRFHDIGQEAAARLQDLIGSFLGHILAAQKANAAGEDGESAGQQILARLGHARRTRSRGFIAWHFTDGSWKSHPTDVRRQCADGFTVGTHEDDVEVETLCRAYEQADAEGRDLIRLVAELSTLKEE